jgi:ferredoxin
MPDVKVVNLGKTIRAGHGANLRKALLNNGIQPYRGLAKYANCRGNGTCGTCQVDILRGETNEEPLIERMKARSQLDVGLAGIVGGFALQAVQILLLQGTLAAIVGWAGGLGMAVGVLLLAHYQVAERPLGIFGGALRDPKRRLACQVKVYGDIEIDTLTDPDMPCAAKAAEEPAK